MPAPTEEPKDKTNLPDVDTPATGAVEVAMDDPGALSPEQWAKIVDNFQLLKGWRVDGDEPEVPNKIAFELNQKNATPNFQKVSTAEVNTSVFYTERDEKFVHSGFNKQTATATYAFVSASVEHTHKDRKETQNEQKTLYIKGFWDITAAELYFTTGKNAYDIHPTQEFIQDVDRALEGDTVSDQYSKLYQVFREYGQVFASQVTLGGQLYFTHTESYQSNINIQEKEEEVKAAVNLKIGQFSASAGAEWGIGESRYNKALSVSKTADFRAIGGDQNQFDDPSKWRASLTSHDRWYRIGLDEIRPIYELLDEARQTRIKYVLESGKATPPMWLTRFTAASKERQHHASYTLNVPKGYKIISGGAHVIDGQGGNPIGNMLWTSYPSGIDTWKADSWDREDSHVARIEIAVIALYDPSDNWDVRLFKQETESGTQGRLISVAVDPGYYLTGGGAEIFDSQALAKGCVTSFLVSSYPELDKNQWTAFSHDHLPPPDLHKLRVYAIGIKPKDNQSLDVDCWSKTSTGEQQYPVEEAYPVEDYVLVGGGALVNKQINHHLLASYPFATSEPWRASGWRAHSAEHKRSQPALLTVFAIGVKGAVFVENPPDPKEYVKAYAADKLKGLFPGTED